MTESPSFPDRAEHPAPRPPRRGPTAGPTGFPVLRALAAGLLCLGLVAVAGCERTAPLVESVEVLETPAPSESGQPHLHVDADGRLWMSWMEPGEATEHVFRHAALAEGGWTDVGTIAAGDDWFVNWADVPSVVSLPDGRLAAHYLVNSGPQIFAYDALVTQRDRDGAWREPVRPHLDGTLTMHGFVSLVPWAEEELVALWLDGREQAGPDGTLETGGPEVGDMSLRAAILDASGEVLREDLLDDRVCSCCPTAALRTDAGVVAAYRDRSEEEIRDISVVVFDGESWSEPYTLHDDGWHIDACPVNGPALAGGGDRVAAAWFTAADGEPRVKAAFSEDGGVSFGPPVLLDDEGPVGRVDVAMAEDGSAVVGWIGGGDDGAGLTVRRVWPDGAMSEPVALTEVHPGRSTGMPRVALAGSDLYVAWVESVGEGDDEATGVRLARATLAE